MGSRRRTKERSKPLPDHILLAELVRGLVSEPGAVYVEESTVHERTSHMVIHVAPFDRGKVIGKQGNTIESIRFIFMAIASLRGRKVFIEVDEPAREGDERRPFRSDNGEAA